MTLIVRTAMLGTLIALIGTIASADWLRLGSWNIEHLGSNEESTVPIALAEAIHLTGIDILALQEIYDNDERADTKANTQLDAAFAILNEIEGNNWTYEMLPNKSRRDTSQLVTVAWNQARVAKVGDAFRIPIEREGHEWDRHPHALKFSAGTGKTDIVLIALHMKADYRGDFSAQRGREAQLLVDQLDIVNNHFGGDNDIVLIGDLNCDTADEPALLVFAGAGFDDLNKTDEPTHIRWGALDRVLVPAQPEFKYTRQYVLTAADSEAFDLYLSDHQIILAPIKVTTDDD
jgi:predicted extracellular nuclease